jgi:hypothetical protein
MTVYEWVATSNSNANNSANWKPTGVPATGDTAQFNNLSAFACYWDIATVGIIQIDSTYTSIVTFDTNCEIETGLSVSLDNCIDSTTNTTITFSGAPAYNTNKTYVQINTTDMFRTSSARNNLLFKFDGSYYITLDAGTYPHLQFTNGFRPEYIAPTLADNKYNVKVLSMKFGDVNVEPSSATPSSDDRLMNFIIEGTTDLVGTSAQFSLVNNTSNYFFDGGYGTWTFQTTTSGWTLPVSGNTTMGTWTFTWRKWILDSTADGSGSFAFLPFGSVVSLNDLTINRGSSLKGNDSYGATIHLVNRPNIKGTWGFTPIADGIYYYKGLYNLNVSFGGTGLNYIPANRILFGNNSQKLSHSSNLTWDGSDFNINGKLTVSGLIDPTGMVFTPQAVNPESTNPQDTIWLNNEDGHLYRGDRDVESTVHFNVRNDEGSTIPLGAPLYSKGEIGGSNRIKVGIADASDPNKMPAIGLAMEEMNTTSTKDGNMILTGILNENITITGVNEQDIIYVAPHGGSAPYLTITRPTSSSHLVQNVGVCVRQSATNVSQGMKVAAIGRTNDSPNCSFLMVNTESTHPQARRLVAGTNITLTDGGAGGDLTIAASGGGGGGSGTVTSVAISGSDGIEVDSGSPITTSGTIALGVDAPTLRSHINVEDGADVTDATNVASAGAIMDSDFSANGLMERTGSGSYTVNTDIIQTEHLAIDYATGWWTFAVVKGWDALGGSSSQRAMSQFYIQDKRSSRHRTARIEASHQFGVDGSNSLTCFAVSGYGNEIPFTEFRIKEGSTYDGAALQIYISNSLNDLSLHMIFNLGTGDGWTLLSTMLADSDTAGHDALLGDTSRTYVDFATSMTVKKTLDIEEIGFVDANSGGGIATTGGLVVQGSARVAGTFRQGVTNAVLVADANGDLTAASTLADVAYLQAGQAETDIFTPTISAPSWAAPPPANIQEAIERLANALAPLVGGIIP